MLFTWFMLGGFIFLFTPSKLTNKFQLAFARVFHWPLSIGRNISLSARTRQPLTDVVSRGKHVQLQNYLANVEAQLAQELQRNEKLSGLRKKHPLAEAKFAFANIAKSSANELIINRGEKDGLAKGQFVLGDNSIIGTISEVLSHTAKVKLITNATSQIAVTIANQNAIIQGDGKDSAKIPLFPRKHKVQVVDPVFCRPKPGFLNSPMIIGKVIQCKRDDENPLLWDIMVKPACDIEKINYVDVIVMNSQE